LKKKKKILINKKCTFLCGGYSLLESAGLEGDKEISEFYKEKASYVELFCVGNYVLPC
jgi:hypothetical protein